MKDVANAAGVSLSTASRALNGLAEQYRISEATAELVHAKAKEMGFRPSLTARSLRLKRTGLVGIVLPDLSNPFFSAIAREVSIAMEEEGFSSIVGDSDGSLAKEQRILEQMSSRNVESLVVCPVGVGFDHLHDLNRSGLPMVLVDRCCESSELVQVTSDHFLGAKIAIDHLVQFGHRNIGIVQGLQGTHTCQLRLSGVQQALQSAGIPFELSHIAGNDFTFHSGLSSTRELLVRFPGITALFAMSSPNAFGAMQAVREAGRRIPEDISLIAFDDFDFSDFLAVPLTTIAQDVRSLGKKAATLLLKQLGGHVADLKAIHKLPVTLMQKNSVTKVSPK